MKEEMIFNILEKARANTLQNAEGITEEAADQMPDGFNNTIRWHLGHIYVATERLCMQLSGHESGYSEEEAGFFAKGTKPGDWSKKPPTLDEILAKLKEQPARIRQQLEGHLNDPLAVPFQNFQTVGEVVLYSAYHEGVHSGYASALKRIVGN